MLNFIINFLMDELKVLGWTFGFGIFCIILGAILMFTAIWMEKKIKKSDIYKRICNWLYE